MPHVRLARPLLEILMSSNLSDTRFKTTANGQRLRWSPPATKVQIGMVNRVLSRKLAAITPESKLVLAMITQAIADCHERDDRDRHDARRFLTSRRLDFWCDLLDIEAEFVRMVAVRSGFLVDESLLWTPVIKMRRRLFKSAPTMAGAHAGL
jgi:hypothetical protein